MITKQFFNADGALVGFEATGFRPGTCFAPARTYVNAQRVAYFERIAAVGLPDDGTVLHFGDAEPLFIKELYEDVLEAFRGAREAVA